MIFIEAKKSEKGWLQVFSCDRNNGKGYDSKGYENNGITSCHKRIIAGGLYAPPASLWALSLAKEAPLSSIPSLPSTVLHPKTPKLDSSPVDDAKLDDDPTPPEPDDRLGS